MNWLDIVIIGLIVTSMVISLLRGFVRELFSIVTWIGAFVIGFQFSDSLAVTLADWIHSENFRQILSFMLVFSLTLLAGSTLSFYLVKLLHKTGFGVTDRLFGVVFGFTRGVLLVSLILMIGGYTAFSRSVVWSTAVTVDYFSPISHWLQSFLPDSSAETTDQQEGNKEKTLPDLKKKIEDGIKKLKPDQ